MVAKICEYYNPWNSDVWIENIKYFDTLMRYTNK